MAIFLPDSFERQLLRTIPDIVSAQIYCGSPRHKGKHCGRKKACGDLGLRRFEEDFNEAIQQLVQWGGVFMGEDPKYVLCQTFFLLGRTTDDESRAVVNGTSPTIRPKWIGPALLPSRSGSHGLNGGTKSLVRRTLFVLAWNITDD